MTIREGVATPFKLPTLLSLLTLSVLLTIHCLHMGHTYFAILFERFKHVAQNGPQELYAIRLGWMGRDWMGWDGSY